MCFLWLRGILSKISTAARRLLEAESDFHPSIRATLHISGWDGQVAVDGAACFTEEDWVERKAIQAPDRAFGGALSLRVWPFPLTRSVISPGFNHSWACLAVYTKAGE